MMKLHNKRMIIFGSFTLICMLSICFVLKNNIKYFELGKRVVVSEVVQEESAVGDSNCKTTKKTCYYTCSSYVNTGSRPNNCKSSTPTGCTTDSSFYVSCTSTGGVPCSKTESYTCTECNDGYYLSNGKCESIAVSAVNGGGVKYIAADENATFSFTATSDPSDASGFAPEWGLSAETGVISKTVSGGAFVFTTTGGKAGTGSNCAKTEYTVTATAGGVSKTATATVCKYCSSWRGPIKANILSTTKRNTSKPDKGCYYYSGETKVNGGWRYTAYYTRCCGNPPKSDFGACYGNKQYLGIATNAGWQEAATSNRPYKYEGVKEEDCDTIDVNICNASSTSPAAITKETDKCEDSKEIAYGDVTLCGNNDDTSNNFYTITCNQHINSKFDYGDDSDSSTSRVLYKGQGFRYSIKVTSVHTCTALFNEKIWMEVYNKYLTKIKFVDTSLVKYVQDHDYSGWEKAVKRLNASDETKSEVFELWNILKELENIVIDGYMNYKPGTKYEEQATVNLTYKANKKSNTITEDLIVSEDDFIEGEYTKILEGKKYNLTSKLKNVPEKYVLTNQYNPRVVKLIPKRVYIDKYFGMNAGNVDSGIEYVDGGNKIYTDYSIDATQNGEKYPLSITLTGLGSNKSTIINNKCDIEVVEDEITYRSIDVTNPFINSNWKIGKNWVNDRFSFTNTIKSNTWALNSIYTVELTSSDIETIKRINNEVDSSKHISICRSDLNIQDSVINKICNVIKETID